MFCQNCGAQAGGNYCTRCRTKLGAVAIDVPMVALVADWRDRRCLDQLFDDLETLHK